MTPEEQVILQAEINASNAAQAQNLLQGKFKSLADDHKKLAKEVAETRSLCVHLAEKILSIEKHLAEQSKPAQSERNEDPERRVREQKPIH